MAQKKYSYNGVSITWLGHDGFKITEDSKVLVIDPFKLSDEERADYVLISHEHFDHCNADDLRKVVKPSTVVVATESCKNEVSKAGAKQIKTIGPGDTVKLGDDYEVHAIPAYNTNKYREPGKHFHPKAEGKVGYIVKTRNGTTIYHTGDSDHIPEMEGLKPDIALLPVSGTYVMTADEAVEAVSKIRPRVAIPMHYGTIVGSESDAEKFKNKANCEVVILEKA